MSEHYQYPRYSFQRVIIDGLAVPTIVKEDKTGAVVALSHNQDGLYEVSNNELDVEEVLAQAQQILTNAK